MSPRLLLKIAFKGSRHLWRLSHIRKLGFAPGLFPLVEQDILDSPCAVHLYHTLDNTCTSVLPYTGKMVDDSADANQYKGDIK